MPGYSASLVVMVDGAPLDPLVQNQLIQVTVDTSLYLPDMVVLTFRDPARTVIEAGGFAFGAEVAVTGRTSTMVEPLALTRVSAVEVDADHEGALTVVRALDGSASAMRGTNTMVYEEMLISEIAVALATEAGLIPGEVMPTDDPVPYLVQPNVSNWDFIQMLAKRAGYLAWTSRGMFNFGPMPMAEEAGPPGTLAVPPVATQLVLGQNLSRLRGRVTASGQVDAISGQGWDTMAAIPLVVPAPPFNPGVVTVPPTQGLVGDEAGELFTVASGLDDPGQVEGLAMGAAARLAASAVAFDGEAEGNPMLVAGTPCSIGNAGIPFDGQYVLTGARHVWDGRRQYRTSVSVGASDHSVLGLASGPSDTRVGHMGGVVCGMVVDNNDPEELGRVKVQFGWMGELAISDWARVVYPGASKGWGVLFVPELGDEVLVGFEHGDFNRAYVLGALHGLVNPALAEGFVDGGLVVKRRISSKFQHHLTFNDGPDENGIVLQTGDMVIGIAMDAEEQMLQVTCQGGMVTVAGGVVSVTAEETMSLTCGENSITLSDAGVVLAGSTITATGESGVTIAGSDVAVAGETSVSVVAPSVLLGA